MYTTAIARTNIKILTESAPRKATLRTNTMVYLYIGLAHPVAHVTMNEYNNLNTLI
jgi:hypothetical protein